MALNLNPDVNLSDPIWTIEHVARCFVMSVDRAREYAARDDFPEARRLGGTRGRLFWTRDSVLAWFANLPALSAADRRGATSVHEVRPRVRTNIAYKPSYTPRTRKPLSEVGSR